MTPHPRHILFVALLTAALSACQIIPEDEQLIPVASEEPVSRALLVECTGFLCVNCPNAASAAHTLLAAYPDNLVVVEVHPATNTFCQTTIPAYDYTCPEADSIYRYLGGTTTTAFPTGAINLISGLTDYVTWPAIVSGAVHRAKQAALTLSCSIKDGRTLAINYHLDALSTDDTKDGQPLSLRTMLWLTEDSIIGPQMMPDGSQNMAYVHNHVLRGTVLPSVWGEESSPLINQPSNDIHTLDFTIPDSIHGQAIDMQHCAVVGVVTLSSTGEVQDVMRVPVAE